MAARTGRQKTVPMTYRFNDFELNPATRELREGGELLALPARAFDCLAYLIEHRDRAVGRDELIAAVWGRTEISDALLSHTVVKIRRSLRDTGNEQRTIRTVPRFGYRWVGAIESEEAQEAAASPLREVATAVPEPVATAIQEPETVVPEADVASAAPIRRARFSRFGLAAALVAAAVIAVLVIAFALTWISARQAPPIDGAAPRGADAAAEPALATPALVLPAEVNAPDDWRWLRFGLMDLVARRLRSGALPTMPSESVVGLLKQRGKDGDDLLHDPALAQVATLRVLPRVRLDGERWNVRLDAFGSQRSFSVEAQSGDAISAARTAADLLLRKLDRGVQDPEAEPSTPRLDALLQRSGAAMLADQLDQARKLIESAPADLQQMPRVQQRMAQIELRAGDYPAVEARLQAQLDTPAVRRDPALHARMLITLAAAHVRRNQAERASELYEEAIALRRDQPDHEALGVARLGRGVLLARKGQYDEATAELSRARVELGAIGDALNVASVDVNLGEFQLMRHRPADALPILRNAAQEFERLGAREGRAYALAQQADAEREMLEFEAAFGTTQRFWPPGEHTSNARMRWTLTAARAAALVDLGRLIDAQALIARIDGDSDAQEDIIARTEAQATAAHVAWLRGDPASTLSSADAALVPALREADPASWTRTSLLKARALRASGRLDEAGQATQALCAAAAGDEWCAMLATLGEAEQALATNHLQPALDLFATALKAAGKINVPEDLVAVAAPYVDALIAASQLDTARTVGGRIAAWAERDPRAAAAQLHLYRALGEDDAARKAEETLARLTRESLQRDEGATH